MALPSGFSQQGPSTLVIREGGGCLSVFGLMFLTPGLFVLGIAIDLVKVNNAQEMDMTARLIMGAMGVVFTLVGGWMVFGRQWITIDKIRRQITRQMGLLVPMKKDVSSVADFGAVSLSFDAGDSDSADRYPVVLIGTSGARELKIASPTDYKDAHEKAAFLASFLHLPLQDQTTDNVIRSRPEDIDKPFYKTDAALQNGDEGTASPTPRPLNMASVVEERGDELSISIPAPKLSPFHFLWGLVPIVIAYHFFPNFYELKKVDIHKVEDVFSLFFLGFFVLFFVLIPLGSMYGRYKRAKTGATSICISKYGITIDKMEANGQMSEKLPLSSVLAIERRVVKETFGDDIKTLNPRLRTRMRIVRHIQKINRIVFKTPSQIIEVGEGLPDAEILYLHGLITQKITKLGRGQL